MKRYIILLLLFWLGSANAVLLSDLYTFNTMVPDNGQNTRVDQLPVALKEVLQKVAGSNVFLENTQVVDAVQHPEKYVRGFTYKARADQYLLEINFDEQMINQLLTSAGRSNVSKNRPMVMTWLVIHDGKKVDFAGSGVYPEVDQQLEKLSRNYGTPLVLPLLDLTERLFITPNDVATFNEVPLQQLAGRYNTDFVLAGRIAWRDGKWNADWRLYSGVQIIDWSSTGSDLNLELENMLVKVSDQLLSYYASINKSKIPDNAVVVKVQGIKDVADYARVMDYLLSLNQIKNVEVSSVNDQEAVFTVFAEGGKRAINSAISLDRVLVADIMDLETEYLSYRASL